MMMIIEGEREDKKWKVRLFDLKITDASWYEWSTDDC